MLGLYSQRDGGAFRPPDRSAFLSAAFAALRMLLRQCSGAISWSSLLGFMAMALSPGY
jgi:hypothetical protein